MNSPREHEHRFLVSDPSVLHGHSGNLIVQGYLFDVDGYVVRVRRTHARTEDGTKFVEQPPMLTVKGPRVGTSRIEYEWPVDVAFAAELLKRTGAKIVKARYQIVDTGQLWDVDVFQSANEGLIIAECETVERPALPTWVGDEVTRDRRYDNEALARHPHANW